MLFQIDKRPTGPPRADAVGFDAERFEDDKWETIHINPSASAGPDGIDITKTKKANPTLHFAHLFNAYAKYVNEKYDRHGSLFQRPFKRKPIGDEDYLRQVVIYIHSNPVHHGFVDHPGDYPWSSYHTCLGSEPTKLHGAVLEWFGGAGNFKEVHHDPFDHAELEAWLEVEDAI